MTSTAPSRRTVLDLSQALDFTGKGLLEIIRAEHNIVLNLYDRYKTTTSNIEKRALGYNLIKLLSIHSAKEEMVLYPLIRKKFPQGDELADKCLEEHLSLKKDLYELDQLGDEATIQQVDTKVRASFEDLSTHLAHEEANVLTQLPKYLQPQELIEARDSFVRHLSLAPSHPHPSAPDKPPSNIAANTASVPLDAAKDLLTFSGSKPTSEDLASGNVLDMNAMPSK